MKIFPFSPVWWKLRSDVVQTSLSTSGWAKLIGKRNLVVSTSQGFLEAFLSLSFLEGLKVLHPDNSLFWSAPPMFRELGVWQGLAQPFEGLTDFDLERFPVPIFWDKDGRTYFNSCFNYPIKKDIQGYKIGKSSGIILNQILRNFIQDWNISYTPQFRCSQPRSQLIQWLKIYQVEKKPFITILPDVTGYSCRKEKFLKWSPTQVKEMAAIMATHGYGTVVLSPQPQLYKDKHIHTFVPQSTDIIWFLSQTKAVLSREIDFLLVSMFLSNSPLIGSLSSLKYSIKLELNRSFLGKRATPLVYLRRKLLPAEAAEVIVKGKSHA